MEHGRHLLRGYLGLDRPPDERPESITKFAGRAGLDRIWLQRLLKFGKPERVSTFDAKKIDDATGGQVPIESFAEPTPDNVIEANDCPDAPTTETGSDAGDAA